LLHGKKEFFLEGANGLDKTKEDEANRFAQEELIPKAEFAHFAQQHLTNAAILAFSKRIGIAPGIVVGQLQHAGILPVFRCNELKRKFKWDHE
jgi:HTH-type transcriptional regulator/antitoxin HigA